MHTRFHEFAGATAIFALPDDANIGFVLLLELIALETKRVPHAFSTFMSNQPRRKAGFLIFYT
jgi:hypothetical protein